MTKAQQALWAKLRSFSHDGQRDVLRARELEAGHLLDRWEAVDFIQKFAREGWGRYVVGRRGFETRLLLDPHTLRSLRTPASAPSADGIAPASPPNGNSADSVEEFEHVFQLRPDYLVKVLLPKDLSEKEATRLGRYVESLPM